MQQAKGASSKLAADLSRGHCSFRWQEGYGAFSLSRPDVSKVISYVENQVCHHTTDKVWLALEETDEEVACDKALESVPI
jgi:putative transposase